MRERKPSSVTSSCGTCQEIFLEDFRHRSARTYELVLLAADVGDVHVVGGRAQLFELLASEDVDGDQVDFGVSVLAGLRGGHVDDLARAVLDADEAVLPQSRALQRVGERSTGIGAVEGVLVLWVVLLADGHVGWNSDLEI
jgi:hypothetical protein